MNQTEREQIENVIINFEETRKYVPFFSDLESHSTFGSVFKNLDKQQRVEVENIIKEYITSKIDSLKKTKWGQLFKRFFEWFNELFWEFRELNEKSDNIESSQFQKIWKIVEWEMFKLEWILTEKMFNQEKWLDKVVGSFYNIVYTFFPRYSDIE